ncbi:spore germination protein [Paenibacillus pasadenensis]|nr:spore germination protein [Paenibacillus pasadenensis]MCM3748897.1 spore germination protein [Paenibacillus pasadenensis]
MLPEKDHESLSDSLEENLDRIRASLGNSWDLAIRSIFLGSSGDIRVAVLHMNGLSDNKLISRFMESFMLNGKEVSLAGPGNEDGPAHTLRSLKDHLITLGTVEEKHDYKAILNCLLSGDSIILADRCDSVLVAATKGWDERGVQEASVQTVVRGPRESFSENLGTNIALLRRKIKSPSLWVETTTIGRITETNVSIAYVKWTVNEEVVDEVRRRLADIDIDGILESGNIEEWIQDKTFTPFPTMLNTERPDVVAANLLEGRVAIFVDGTPVVLLVPVVFMQFFQSPEDYYNRSDFGLLRMLRFVALFTTLLAPAVFISITTFHQEMLPPTLMISIASQRERVPFPAAVEAFLMEFTFELLREAGIRMPRAVGPAISIVGALVLGEAAVQAGIVSSAMVIIVSITAITSFVFPSFSMTIPIRFLRFVLMGLAAFCGLFGVFIGLIAINLHLCGLYSFGVPYMSPIAPTILGDQKDLFIRLPQWMMRKRPSFIGSPNKTRISQGEASSKFPSWQGDDGNR